MNERGDQANKVPVAGLARGDENDVEEALLRGAPGRSGSGVSPKSIATWQPTIGWMPLLDHLLGEFERAKKVAGVGKAKRRHAVGLGEARQLLDLQRPLEQRIGRVDPEMDETDLVGDATHARDPPRAKCRGRPNACP